MQNLQSSTCTQSVNISNCINTLRHAIDNLSATNLHTEESVNQLTGVLPHVNSGCTLIKPTEPMQYSETKPQTYGKEKELSMNASTYHMVQGPKDPLSNFYPCMMECDVNGRMIKFLSLEQAFQYKKAKFLECHETAEKILTCRAAAQAKYHGDSLNENPNIENWKAGQATEMELLLKTKLNVYSKFKHKLTNTRNAKLLHSVALARKHIR